MRFFPMDIKQQHGLKVGDLVKFKHHIFDGFTPVHLVTGVSSRDSYDGSVSIRLHDNTGIFRRASDFVVVKRAKR